MKKLISFVLILSMILSVFSMNISVFAEESPEISVETQRVRKGQRIFVDVEVKNNPGVVSMLLGVEFDDKNMTLLSVKDGGILGQSTHSPDFSKSPYTLYWNNNTATENFCEDGVIVTLEFMVSADAKTGEYPVSIVYSNDRNEIMNKDLDTVDFEVANGKIVVQNTLPFDVDEDGLLTAKDAIMISRNIASWPGYTENEMNLNAGDYDNDGYVTAKDAILLARHLANWPGYVIELENIPNTPDEPSEPEQPDEPDEPSEPVIPENMEGFEPDENDVIVNISDIDYVRSSYSANEGYIQVYEDGVVTKYYIDADTEVFVNDSLTETGVEIDNDTFCYDSGNRYDGKAMFEYEQDSNVISKIYMYYWQTDIVDEVSSNGLKVFLNSGYILNFDVAGTEREELFTYSIILNGEKIEPSDLTGGDVITYISKEVSGISRPINYTIFVSRATVEGKSELYDVDEDSFTIAGKSYKISNSAVEVAGGYEEDLGITQDVKVGRIAGVFYLDVFGNVAYFKEGAGATDEINYGYFVSDMKDNFNEDAYFFEASIKMLTKDGVAIYDFVDEPVIKTITKDGVGLECTNRKYKIANEANAMARAEFKADMRAIVDAAALIAYELDGEKIKTVYNFSGAAAAIGNKDYLAWNGDMEYAEYTESNKRIGNYFVDENTVVFVVGAADVEDFFVTDAVSYFVDGYNYAEPSAPMKVYGADDDKVADALLVQVDVRHDIEMSNLVLFYKYALTTNEDDEMITRIHYYQNGEEKTIDSEYQWSSSEMNQVKALWAGDIIAFSTNHKGYITEPPFVVGPEINYSDLGYWEFAYPPADATIAYANGMVIDKNGNVLKLGASVDEWENHSIPEDANIYIVEKMNTKNVITVGTVADIYKNTFFSEKGVDGSGIGAGRLYNIADEDNYQVVLKYIKGEITDVVVYKNFMEGFVEE